jgi:hypothetical protein
LFFTATNGNPLQLVQLPANQTDPNARCLDGSPPAYYLRQGNINKWVITFRGYVVVNDEGKITSIVSLFVMQ